jgi:Holliday junction resolvase RusA-like endonuclease
MPRPKAHLILRGGKYVPRMQYLYVRPAHAPDIDKLLRAVMDALTGIAYADDSQVIEVMVSKVYGDTTFIEVSDDDQQSPQRTLSSWLGDNSQTGVDKG